MNQCNFRFDFEQTGSGVPYDLTDIDGTVWNCPHAGVEGHELCVFHLPVEEKNDAHARNSLLSELRSEGSSRIYGAQFGELNLRYQNLQSETRHPIDLSYISVEKTLDLSNTLISQPFILDEGEFNRVRLDDAYFMNEVRFTHSKFSNTVSLANAEFRSLLEFSESKFDGTVDLSQATCRGSVKFDTVDLNRFTAHNTAFKEIINFRETNFRKGCSFRGADINGKADFSTSQFHSEVDFREITVNKTLDCEYISFNEIVDFNEATIRGELRLQRAKFLENPLFRNAEIEQLEMQGIGTGNSARVLDFEDAQISNGTLDVGGDPAIGANLHNTTVGDLKIESSDESSVFEYLRVVNTTFEKFNFQIYRQDLVATGYNIHALAPDLLDSFEPLSPAILEQTYLKARKGAQQIDDSVTRSEFFLKQMHFRKRQQLDAFRKSEATISTRLFALNRYLTGVFLSWTCGFGERPGRVISLASSTIIAFAIVYNQFPLSTPRDSILDSLLFSIQAFNALIIGAPSTVSRNLTIFVVTEAFIGAITLSLFVVTLTRSFDTDG